MPRSAIAVALMTVGTLIGMVVTACLAIAKRADLNAQQRFCRDNCPYCPYYDPEAME